MAEKRPKRRFFSRSSSTILSHHGDTTQTTNMHSTVSGGSTASSPRRRTLPENPSISSGILAATLSLSSLALEGPGTPTTSTTQADSKAPVEPIEQVDPVEPLEHVTPASLPDGHASISIDKPDLWTMAFRQGDFTEQQKRVLLGSAALNGASWSPITLVEQITDSASTRVLECQRSGWFAGPHGDKIAVIQQAETVVSAVLGIKEFVDAGLKFDVSGYGATAWSIISVGLKLIQNDQNRTQALFDASAYLADVLSRYACYEKHYNDPEVEDWAHLQDCIVNVYTAVLKYAAEVKLAQHSTISQRVAASFRALVGEPLQDLKTEITNLDEAAKEWLAPIAHQLQLNEFRSVKEQAANILSSISRVSETAENVFNSMIATGEKQTRNWFFEGLPPRFVEIQVDLHKFRSKLETGQWFLDSRIFQDWKYYPQQLLWVQGGAGCGKSCLCYNLINHLLATHQNDSRKCVAFWFFKDAGAEMKEFERAISSLLMQLLANFNRIPPYVGAFVEEHINGRKIRSVDTLDQLLRQVIRDIDRDIFLVLDGLDKCGESAARAESQNLAAKFVRTLAEQGFGNLHILVSSKRNSSTEEILESVLIPSRIFDVTHDINSDIEAFIKYQMEHLHSFQRASPDTRMLVEAKLKQHEQKSFRWTDAQLKALGKCKTEKAILAALERVPGAVETIYKNALAEIEEQDQPVVGDLLHILCLKKGRLDLDQLADFARLEAANAVIDLVPDVLIDVNEQSEVQLVHPALRQYLQSGKLSSEKHDLHLSPGHAHTSIALRCLDYLLKRDNGPFLGYAAEFWSAHVKESHVANDYRHDIHRKAFELLNESNPSYHHWLRARTMNGDDDCLVEQEFLPPIYAALQLRMPVLAMDILHRDQRTFMSRGQRGTVLQIAAHHDFPYVVKQLLQQGADPNDEPGQYGTALYAACARNCLSSVKCMLRTDKTKPLLNENSAYLGTALQHVSFFGSTHIAQMLLDAGADPNHAGGLFGDALQSAAAAGHREVVAMLLRKGAHLETSHGALGSPFQAAMSGEHFGVRRLLLDKGAQFSKSGRFWKMAIDKTFADQPAWLTPSLMHTKMVGCMDFESSVRLSLTPMQRLTAAIIRLHTPSPEFERQLIRLFPNYWETMLGSEIIAAFDRGLAFKWDSVQPPMDFSSTFFISKYFFRAAIHAFFFELPECDQETADFLGNLLGAWRRTEPYEDFVIETEKCMVNITLGTQLVDFFYTMIRALAAAYGEKWIHRAPESMQTSYRDASAQKKLPSYQEMWNDIQEREEDLHSLAKRYLLIKQVYLAENLTVDQQKLADKLNTVEGRVARLEESVVSSLERLRGALCALLTPEQAAMIEHS